MVKKTTKVAGAAFESGQEEEEAEVQPEITTPKVKPAAKPVKAAAKPAKAAAKPAKKAAKPAKAAAKPAKKAGKKKGEGKKAPVGPGTKEVVEGKKVSKWSKATRINLGVRAISKPALKLLMKVRLADKLGVNISGKKAIGADALVKALTAAGLVTSGEPTKYLEAVNGLEKGAKPFMTMDEGVMAVMQYLEGQVIPDMARGLANDAWIRSKALSLPKLQAHEAKTGGTRKRKQRIFAGGVSPRTGKNPVTRDNEFLMVTWAGKDLFNTFNPEINCYEPADIFGEGKDMYEVFSAHFAKQRAGTAKGKDFITPAMLGKFSLVRGNALEKVMNANVPTKTIGTYTVPLHITLAKGIASPDLMAKFNAAKSAWLKNKTEANAAKYLDLKTQVTMEKQKSSSIFMVNKVLIDTVLSICDLLAVSAAQAAASGPKKAWKKITSGRATVAINSLNDVLLQEQGRTQAMDVATLKAEERMLSPAQNVVFMHGGKPSKPAKGGKKPKKEEEEEE